MFDGFKITIRDQLIIKRLHQNELLEFIEHTNTITGEVKNQTADYKGLKITTYPAGLIEVKGSFHKYYNHGFHNYDDFTITKMSAVVNNLQSDLDLNLFKASINNLEFGFNLNTPFAPNALINSLHCFKWNQFNIMDTKGPGTGKECKSYGQYVVKIYNKGLQYAQPQNILRIEKKVMVMCALKFGPLCLSDLLNPQLWEHCKLELIKMFDDVLINEPLETNMLTKNQQRIYNTVVNQSNWINFKKDNRKRYKKAFNEIISKYGKVQYRPIVLKLINDKCIELSGN